MFRHAVATPFRLIFCHSLSYRNFSCRTNRDGKFDGLNLFSIAQAFLFFVISTGWEEFTGDFRANVLTNCPNFCKICFDKGAVRLKKAVAEYDTLRQNSPSVFSMYETILYGNRNCCTSGTFFSRQTPYPYTKPERDS